MRACVRVAPLMLAAGIVLAGCTEPSGQKKDGLTKAAAITDDMYVVKVEGMS